MEEKDKVIEVALLHDFPETVLARARELYLQARWVTEAEDCAFLLPALRGSAAVAAAWDSGRLVGLARALSDGVSDAYIQDVVVDSGFRRQGIGGRLIRTLVQELHSRGVDWIALVGEPGTENFYRALGWEEKPGFSMWQLHERKQPGRC